jgi:ubiquinone/menaquinone biosynthesis C-methylase UbiE
MSQQTKEIFYQQLFSNTNIKFNDSCADTIYGVEDSSQDYVLLAFLLNNLKDKDDVFHALVEALNKLKR